MAALANLQKACDVDTLKMSDFGISPDLFEEYAEHAHVDMAGLFTVDRKSLSREDVVNILRESYK
ncbi:MAG: hypothetical protein ATN35_04120 [Epulopiscium sp. Nele67-Bin004]|nr:MAG: hypothetical protein ATN35_04120 [Epulopiscium sp. Nele67-Bin004]